MLLQHFNSCNLYIIPDWKRSSKEVNQLAYVTGVNNNSE